MEKKRILILGGARSGKSKFALSLASGISSRIFIATMEPKDEEMRQRVEEHKKQRGKEWQLIEEPIQLIQELRKALSEADAVVVDCITLWISNLLLEGKREEEILKRAEELAEIITQANSLLIFVSNEVGAGIVPEYPLSRKFRDLSGKVNQILASVCDEVYLMVAGIPVLVKGGEK